MILGVTAGFLQGTAVINGVGYRAEVKGKSLLLNLGYSTQFEYMIPEGNQYRCGSPTPRSPSAVSGRIR
jgi:ribosomal protein L6P/L9E